ncbi:MAG: hypothetical protein ACLFWF_10585 [Alphaproteobacteria bacterium]
MKEIAISRRAALPPRSAAAPDRTGASLRNPMHGIRHLNRLAERWYAEDQDYFLRPPVIVNSFPNSGAHLVARLARAFAGSRDYGSTLKSLPTIPFRERSDAALDRLIRRIVPGEIVSAHLFFSEAHARRIAARNGVHFFVYRDLRDAAIAEAQELTCVKFWHRLHPFFAGLGNDADRISAAIQGFGHGRFPYDYPHIAHRFARYEGWLNRPDVMPIAWEDLHSDRFADVVRAMARFYLRRCRAPADEEQITAAARRIADEEAAGLLRSMAPGAWACAFTAEHHRRFEKIAGALNRRLGYGGTEGRAGEAASSAVVLFGSARRKAGA